MSAGIMRKAVLELLYNWERFWHEIEPFLSDLPVPENVFSELLLYQKFIIRRPGIFRIHKSSHLTFNPILTAFTPLVFHP